MRVSKVTISLDLKVLKRVDQIVNARVFPNRSRAIQAAIEGNRLACECAKLDPTYEQALADEGWAAEPHPNMIVPGANRR